MCRLLTKLIGKRPWRRLAWLVTFAVAIWLLSSVAVAYKLTRRPFAAFPEPTPQIDWTVVESLRLTTRDGQQIGAWFFAGKSDRPAVLLLHGYSANRGASLSMAEYFVRQGCPTLAISMRAHGDSTGDTTDFGYSARHDVVAAVEWLRTRQPNQPIVIWGQSFGAAAAVFASEELGDRVSGYVLDCPYQDLRTAVRNRLSSRLPMPLDALAALGLRIVGPLFIADAGSISPLHAIEKMPRSCQVLILSGGGDRSATPAEGQAICDAANCQAQFIVIPEAGHSQLHRVDQVRYDQAIEQLLGRCPCK